MTMVDPYSVILLTIRDDPEVRAITTRVGAVILKPPPLVQLTALTTSRAPFGRGSENAGMQLWQGIAKCYAPDDDTGPIVASLLARAVSEAIHGKGHLDGSAFVLRAYASTIGEALRDPETKWPYHTVRIEAYAAAQAVA